MAFLRKSWSDEAFLNGLLAGGAAAHRAENEVYRQFLPLVHELSLIHI